MDIKENKNDPLFYYPTSVLDMSQAKKFPSELTELLPEQIQKNLCKFIPVTTITKTENCKIKLNPLGKELVASVEGKLCKLGKKDPKNVNYYLFKGSDFDGTLSLLVQKADDAKPIGSVVDHLVDLNHLPNIRPGIITGRGVNDLLEKIAKSDNPKYEYSQVKDKLFISGLHGLERLENNKLKANISSQQEEVLNTVRKKVENYQRSIPKDENKITLFEDKGCAYAFHFDAQSNDKDRKQALTRALNIMKNADVQVVMPDSPKGSKEKELVALINQAGIKHINNDNVNNKNNTFKLIYGSGVLEMIPPGSDKGTVFTDLFNNYKESIADKLKNNSRAKIIASYSGDDTTDFDAFKAIMKLKQADERVEPAAILVVNNRQPDLSAKIKEVNGDLTKIGILENNEFLNGQNKLLNALEEYYQTKN